MLNLIILILPVAAIFLMFRSQKKRQAQQQQMQTALQAGSGVRTIGGMYALVKAVNDETVELEIAPGVTTHFIKSAIAVVLEPLEYDAIINGRPVEDEEPEGAEVEDEVVEDGKGAEAKAEGESPESK